MSTSTVEKRYLHSTSYNEAVVSDNYSFSSPLTSLKFRNGICLTAHREFLIQSPRLVSLITRHDSFPETINLSDVSYAAGQILVAHLYTGRWTELAWFGPEGGLEEIARLETAFEVYLAARKYELCSLEALAQIHIEQDAARLDTFTVIDIAKRVYPVPDSSDTWFQEHIKSRIKADFDKPDSVLSARLDTNFADETSIIKLVFKGMLEAYREKTEALAKQAATLRRPFTPTSDTSFEEVDCQLLGAAAEEQTVISNKDDSQTPAPATTPCTVPPTLNVVETLAQDPKPHLDKSVYELAPEASGESSSDTLKLDLVQPATLDSVTESAAEEPTPLEVVPDLQFEPELQASDNNSNSGAATATGTKVKKCKHKVTKARWECKACGKCTRPTCVSCKCSMCKRKCRDESHHVISDPVVEEALPDAVPEVAPLADPTPALVEDDSWDFAGTSSKNSERNLENIGVVIVDPVPESVTNQEPVPELVPEPQPLVEDVPRDSFDMASNDKKKEAKKAKKKGVVRLEAESPLLEIEPVPLVEPEPAPKPKPSVEDNSWGFPSTKFTKKKAKAVVGTGSEPASEVSGNAQLIAEIERGFPQGGWDFWGAAKKR
ncbi:hypothetical protein B0T21DRAFT_348373 [Apiosordaria backusii]|uniref:BTB domain-containing protein n=1 Tax=Apiosordaria backusii TaxID=314023 RepID=A0AA40BLC6_9PEZI|nr:hypothetical protein B0T21DRAFT_348373 [Apiosordaria backusii]